MKGVVFINRLFYSITNVVNYPNYVNASADHKPKKTSTSTDKFVSLCGARLSGNHRTGNHLFMLAAMLHLAKLTNRTLVLPTSGWRLENIFDLKESVYKVANVEPTLCPCLTVNTPHYNYDERFDNSKFIEEWSKSNNTLLICGLSQTYKHAQAVENELRELLIFHKKVYDEAKTFLKGIKHSILHFFVGVHVRRGDFLTKQSADYGLTVIDANYLNDAFRYFVVLHNKTEIQFVVATDDKNWTLSNKPKFHAPSLIYVTDKSTEIDLAILALCDGMIVSTGSFGWWGAWIAKKPTVYYRKWPRKDSTFYANWNRQNYFLMDWVPM